MAMMLALASLAGCATRTVSVDHRMLLPEQGARHEMAPTQFFVMPMTLASPEPTFPPAAEGQDTIGAGTIDVTVCAEIWLSADGDITRIAPFDDTPGCADRADPQAQAYAQSVAETLQRWEFTPAMVCEFPPHLLDKRARGDCTGAEVAVRRVPVRLNYAFTFSSRDGRRRVGVAPGAVSGSASSR